MWTSVGFIDVFFFWVWFRGWARWWMCTSPSQGLATHNLQAALVDALRSTSAVEELHVMFHCSWEKRRNPQKTFLSCFQNYRSWYTRHKRTHSCFIPPRVNKFLFLLYSHPPPEKPSKPSSGNSERFSKSKGNHSHTAAHDSNSNSLYEWAPANTLSSTTPINEEENYRLKFVCCFSPLKAAPPKNNCAWGEIMMIIWRSVNNNSKAFSPLHIRRKLFMSFIIVLSHSTFIIILSAWKLKVEEFNLFEGSSCIIARAHS